MQLKEDSKSSGFETRVPHYQHRLPGRNTGSFKQDSATEHVSDSFQLTFPEMSQFPSAAPAHPATQYTAAARASQSIPPLRLWLKNQSTLHHGSFLLGRNSISQGKVSPFLWIQLWATRCGHSCTH